MKLDFIEAVRKMSEGSRVTRAGTHMERAGAYCFYDEKREAVMMHEERLGDFKMEILPDDVLADDWKEVA